MPSTAALESLRDQFRRLQIPPLTHQLMEWGQVQQDTNGLPLMPVLSAPNVCCPATFLARTDRAGPELWTDRAGWLNVGSPEPMHWIGQYLGSAEAVKQYTHVAWIAGEALIELEIALPAPKYVRDAVSRTVPDAERILPSPAAPFLRERDFDVEAVNRWTFALHWLGWSGERRLALARRHSLVSGTEIRHDIKEMVKSDTSHIAMKSECEVVLSSIEMVDWLLDQVAKEERGSARPTAREMTPPNAPSGPAGTTEELPPPLITLDQAAALVNRSTRTLGRYKKKGMPRPFVFGGGGKPHEYRWDEMRPWLEKTFSRKIPETAIGRFRHTKIAG